MFGFRYVKVPPTTYLLQFRNGRVRRQGSGLSFVHFVPTSTLVSIPLASADVPFIFPDTTADFQAVSVQGHLTYRVADPARLAAALDYSLRGDAYASEDPARLPLLLSQRVQATTRAEIQVRELRTALVEADAI